jgi:hypothetical protein
MCETSESAFAKLTDNRHVTRYLVGEGIDTGSGSDSLAQGTEHRVLFSFDLRVFCPTGIFMTMESFFRVQLLSQGSVHPF